MRDGGCRAQVLASSALAALASVVSTTRLRMAATTSRAVKTPWSHSGPLCTQDAVRCGASLARMR